MATIFEVLQMVYPNGGYVVRGDNFEGIEFIEAEPITETEFQDNLAQFEIWKAEQEAAKQAAEAEQEAAKQAAEAKLAALGLTVSDLKALGL